MLTLSNQGFIEFAWSLDSELPIKDQISELIEKNKSIFEIEEIYGARISIHLDIMKKEEEEKE